LKKTHLFVVLITGLTLAYGTIDMPNFGDPNAPANHHVAPRYIEKTHEETGVENMVTSVLASYRGFDTFGETTVIFTAGICVIFLLRESGTGKKKKRTK
jgi:multicomponent Na+:H+ antiporter subunit B